MSHLCSMTCRQTLAGFAATVATTSFGAFVTHAAAAGGASAAVILGKGEYRYRVVENWGELPHGYTYVAANKPISKPRWLCCTAS
jgi:hypothetical protein